MRLTQYLEERKKFLSLAPLHVGNVDVAGTPPLQVLHAVHGQVVRRHGAVPGAAVLGRGWKSRGLRLAAGWPLLPHPLSGNYWSLAGWGTHHLVYPGLSTSRLHPSQSSATLYHSRLLNSALSIYLLTPSILFPVLFFSFYHLFLFSALPFQSLLSHSLYVSCPLQCPVHRSVLSTAVSCPLQCAPHKLHPQRFLLSALFS